MSTIEIKRELYEIIDSGDEKFLKDLYEIAKAYQEQFLRDLMIQQGEDDIEAGRTYSMEEAKKMLVSPLVESLTGVLEGDPDYKTEYREYLRKKYL